MNLDEAIQSVDMDEIIDSMNAYAISHLKSVGIKSFKGKLPIDFVGDLILKVMEGTRNFYSVALKVKSLIFSQQIKTKS